MQNKPNSNYLSRPGPDIYNFDYEPLKQKEDEEEEKGRVKVE